MCHHGQHLAWPSAARLPPCRTQTLKPCTTSTGYDEEARYFEASVRADKRKDLVEKAYSAVAGVREGQLAALRRKVLAQFQADLKAAIGGGQQGFTAAAAG